MNSDGAIYIPDEDKTPQDDGSRDTEQIMQLEVFIDQVGRKIESCTPTVVVDNSGEAKAVEWDTALPEYICRYRGIVDLDADHNLTEFPIDVEVGGLTKVAALLLAFRKHDEFAQEPLRDAQPIFEAWQRGKEQGRKIVQAIKDEKEKGAIHIPTPGESKRVGAGRRAQGRPKRDSR